jgi:hypothetical protein
MILAKISIWVILFLFLTGCNRQHIFICSPDESTCITVIDKAFSSTRFVIDGRHYSIPDTNYVKIKNNNEYIYDSISICWDDTDFEWKAIVQFSEITHNKLNSDRFLFITQFETDDRGVPVFDRFRQEGCSDISLDHHHDIIPEGSAIVIKK